MCASRPSRLWGLRDKTVALDFDQAVMILVRTLAPDPLEAFLKGFAKDDSE